MRRSTILLASTIAHVALLAPIAVHAAPPAPAWVPASILKSWKDKPRWTNNQGTGLQGGLLENTLFRGAPPTAGAPAADVAGVRSDLKPLTLHVSPAPAVCAEDQRLPPLYDVRLGVEGGAAENPCADSRIAADAKAPGLSACEQQRFQDLTGKAIAVPGGWGARARYVKSPAREPVVTYACVDGAIAKCLRFGYRLDGGAAASALFGACLRAVRADYCGDGTSFTCNGTPIDFVGGPQRRDADTSGEQLEADWSAEGATCINFARIPGCGQAAQQQKVLANIVARCRRSGHKIAVGKCAPTCAGGSPTCDAAIRTFARPGAGTACEQSERMTIGCGDKQ